MVNLTSRHGIELRERIPLFYHNSEVIRGYLQDVGNEFDLSFQLMGELVLESYIKNANWTIDEWEEMFGIASNPALSIALRRARVASYIVRYQRIRKIDIEAVVREFLDGPKGYVLQQYTNVTKVKVSNVTGFNIGQTIYVGTATTSLISINIFTKEITVLDPISPYPGALVSHNRVDIIESYSNYTFNILVIEDDILDQDSLITAVERAKPAHLGWSLFGIEADTLQGYYNDPTSLSNDPTVLINALSGSVLLYRNLGNEEEVELLYRVIHLTNDQMLLLRATPVQLIPAPGVNKGIHVWGYMVVNDTASGAYTESADNLAIEYGDGTDIDTIETTGFIDGTATKIRSKTDLVQVDDSPISNSPVQIFNNGNGEFGGGDASNIVSVHLWYNIIPTIANVGA